jgi:hypothetical protein
MVRLMQETRHRFHQELINLEHELLAEGEQAADAVENAVQAPDPPGLRARAGGRRGRRRDRFVD